MTDPSHSASSTLKKNALGTAGIVFLVLAAVAPLTGIVVVAGLAMALGNGGGSAASFFTVAIILLIFSVGYAQMSRELVNAGGFYAFVVKGLGRTGGLIAGLIAAIGYNFFVVGTIGTSGFFMQTIIADLTGLDVHWYVWGLASIVASFFMARRGVDFSSKILGIALVLEVALLVVFDIAVLIQTGFSFEAFSPAAVFSGSFPIGLLIAATGFLGFEATALFGEEAKQPLKTIPRATYSAIIAIGLILGLTTWAVVSAIGVAETQGVAVEHLAAGDLLFSLAEQYVGPTYLTVMLILLLVSLFAAMLAFHNSATRYLYSLGRARILPPALARTGSNCTPVTAGLVQAGFAALVALAFMLAGASPLEAIVPPMLGFGTLSIIVLQTLAALSIFVHFRRSRSPKILTTLVAPLISFLLLGTIVVMAIANFDIVAGSDALIIRLLPWLLAITAVGGLIYGAWLKANRPNIYAGLADDLEQFDPGSVPETPSPATEA